jgi:hypothetical protein
MTLAWGDFTGAFMSGPVPTIGYRSKSQAAVALAAIGLPHREIAAKLGVATTTVGALINSGRRARKACTRAGAAEVRIMLGGDTINALQEAAEIRNSTIALVAARILTHAARDNLITAILDDGSKP